MKLNQLADNQGAHKSATRVGRGIGSSKGKTSGRGVKGQKARKSGNVRAGFEGGQNPLYRRLPMRGFNNSNFTKTYAVVNVSTLQAMIEDGRLDAKNPITIESIIASGLTKKPYDGLKILGNGEVSTKLTITAAAASKSAIEKIEKAGGKLEVLAPKEHAKTPNGKLAPKEKK
ncbi:MAG: 50S ribosomal protein L15 [Alphaproteobacteria bacterium CG_4_10_14_0_8_um_filter_53_9]|nr:MAG: 50S ribosomal protein L15 [Alphaproteobacteria bacterium CG_4_10_14_0_8_um_filter_53_9]